MPDFDTVVYNSLKRHYTNNLRYSMYKIDEKYVSCSCLLTSKVNVSVSKNRPPIKLWVFIQTIPLNVFRLMSVSFLYPYGL